MKIVADWMFDPKHIKYGSLESRDIVLADQSGEGNHLVMHTYGEGLPDRAALAWSQDNYEQKADRMSLELRGSHTTGGVYFKTQSGAMLNDLTFEKGYTIEAVLELPVGAYDPWMGILTREGAGYELGKCIGEPEILTTLSYNDMFQWTSYDLEGEENLTNWSCAGGMRTGFHYVTIVNDGKRTVLYLNGIADIRNPKEDMIGISKVEGKGWIVGAAQWDLKLGGLFTGKLQHIRISEGVVAREDWIIQNCNPAMVLEGSDEPRCLLHKENNYNLVFIPDTQYMGESAPYMVEAMTEWISQNAEALHIKFTGHLGDITEDSSHQEYQKGDRAFKTMDRSECPYLVTPGNHDVKDQGVNFRRYFGKLRYKDKTYIGEQEAPNNSLYALIEAGSYTYLMLSIDYSSVKESVSWAQNILMSHLGLPTIVMTHDAFDEIEGEFVRTENGQYLWENLIDTNSQIFMVVAGHEFNVSHRIRYNRDQKEVIEMLVNYQIYPSGGNGWMRLVEVDEEAGKLRCTTYSPWLDQMAAEDKTCYDYTYLTSPKDAFEIDFDLRSR
ncbi:MAG: metallophosphoesterase [Cellulosilyticaceae bacterium]